MKKVLLAFLVLASQLLGHTARADSDIEYYKQFIYQKESIGDDPDFPEYQYRFLMASGMKELPLPDGKTILPSIRLFLLEDGSYTLYYTENLMLPTNPDGTRPFLPGRCHLIKGQWSVPDKTLLLDQVALGSRNLSEGRNRLAFSLTKDLDHAGVAGQEMILDYGYSNSGLDGPQFCF